MIRNIPGTYQITVIIKTDDVIGCNEVFFFRVKPTRVTLKLHKAKVQCLPPCGSLLKLNVIIHINYYKSTVECLSWQEENGDGNLNSTFQRFTPESNKNQDLSLMSSLFPQRRCCSSDQWSTSSTTAAIALISLESHFKLLLNVSWTAWLFHPSLHMHTSLLNVQCNLPVAKCFSSCSHLSHCRAGLKAPCTIKCTLFICSPVPSSLCTAVMTNLPPSPHCVIEQHLILLIFWLQVEKLHLQTCLTPEVLVASALFTVSLNRMCVCVREQGGWLCVCVNGCEWKQIMEEKNTFILHVLCILLDLHDGKHRYGLWGLFLLFLAKCSHKPKHTHLPNS